MHQKGVPEGITVNWTATYRMDSVLPTPYDMFYTNEQLRAMMNQSSFGGKKSRNSGTDRTLNLAEGTFNQGEGKLNHAKGKTKLVAWFVSNCRASNARMEYVRELQKYVSKYNLLFSTFLKSVPALSSLSFSVIINSVQGA